MSISSNGSNERERIRELESYSILDTLPEADYDGLTRIASQICGTPISLITLLDNKRQWFKSHHGLEVSETPKEQAFCAYAIRNPDELYIVEDARKDELFKTNPLVTGAPNIVFYAGVPLKTKKGYPLGTLCVIDTKPRTLSKQQKESLDALATQVMNLLELRKANMELERKNESLKQRNSRLESFATHAAHDIKSPLNSINGITQFLQSKLQDNGDPETDQYLSLISKSAKKLGSLIDGLLEHSKLDDVAAAGKERILLRELKEELIEYFPAYDELRLHFEWSDHKAIEVNIVGLRQILINLISNAIKYNDKPLIDIEIGMREDDRFYEIYVNDNGPGIPEEEREGFFELFKVGKDTDRFGDFGSGIGLATVKEVVKRLGGHISVNSELGKGSIFVFTLAK